MNFGAVPNPGDIDFTLPKDHSDTIKMLAVSANDELEIRVGCAKWNKQDLKNFYPKGVKDELGYYSTQFNSIELNATFYTMYSHSQVAAWKEKTPPDFRFFPKINNAISHMKRLNEVKAITEEYCNNISAFEEKLGMVFLQVHDNFKPKEFGRVEKFIQEFPKGIPLAVEFRSKEWFEKEISDQIAELFKENNITNVLVDTAGRRDIMHMRMTTPVAFIRWVGANHPTDYNRLDSWVERLKIWKQQGLRKIYFFVHQNIELESPLLSAYFIKNLNQELGIELNIPKTMQK